MSEETESLAAPVLREIRLTGSNQLLLLRPKKFAIALTT